MPFCFFLSPFSLSLSSDSHCWIVSERKPNTGREWSLCGISTARGSVLRTLLALSVSPPLVVGGGRWDELPAQVLLWASVGGFTGRHPQGGKHTSRVRGSDKVGGLLLLWLHYFHWWESLLAVLPRRPSSLCCPATFPPFPTPPFPTQTHFWVPRSLFSMRLKRDDASLWLVEWVPGWDLIGLTVYHCLVNHALLNNYKFDILFSSRELKKTVICEIMKLQMEES